MFKSILSMPIIKRITRLFSPIFLLLLAVPDLSMANKNENTTNNNQLIVLFHGLCNNAASFKIIQNKLEETFPSASIVALSSVEGMQSLNLSIKEQAAACFQELKTKVADIANKSVLLTGHSQGGNRAYAFLKQYEHLLKVKGLVTLATPWEGAPGARVNEKMLSEHLTDDVLSDLRTLSTDLGYPANTLEKQLMLEIQRNQSICIFPGAKDLIAGSDFLCEVQKMLTNEKVSILSIGGGQNDFRSLIPNKSNKHSFKALNNMYSFFTVGEDHANKNHDMWIPLYSQHALNILPQNKENFKKVFIKDVFHSAHVWSIIPVPQHKDMLSHPLVLDTIIKYIKKEFSKK